MRLRAFAPRVSQSAPSPAVSNAAVPIKSRPLCQSALGRRLTALTVFGPGLKQFQKGGSLNDLDVLVLFQGKQVPVPADKVGCLSDYGAFQDGVVIGIGADNFQRPGRRYNLGKGADLIGDFRRLARAEISFEPKLFPQFLQNGFAG